MIYFTMHLIIVLVVTYLQYNIKHILLLIKIFFLLSDQSGIDQNSENIKPRKKRRDAWFNILIVFCSFT